MLRIGSSVGSLAVWPLLIGCGLPVCAQISVDPAPKKLAPFVTSPQPIAERMLELARLKPGETVFDLGCGDGRILFAAAKKFGAKAVGVELSPTLAKRATDEAANLGLQDSVKVIQGDMMSIDVSQANVVSLYLLTEANDQLRPKLERELKPGARVVSLEFEMRGWKPVHVESYEAHHRHYKIYVYEIAYRR
jgi:ubiquinone/menaquinone biosynthesis C-methylase UbiE